MYKCLAAIDNLLMVHGTQFDISSQETDPQLESEKLTQKLIRIKIKVVKDENDEEEWVVYECHGEVLMMKMMMEKRQLP